MGGYQPIPDKKPRVTYRSTHTPSQQKIQLPILTTFAKFNGLP